MIKGLKLLDFRLLFVAPLLHGFIISSAIAQITISVNLEHKINSPATGDAQILGYGDKVNPDTNSFIRVHVTGLPDNAYVSRVRIMASRVGPDDQLQENPGPADTLKNRSMMDVQPDGPLSGGGAADKYNTIWIKPPSDPSVIQEIKSILPGAYGTTEVYALVYVKFQATSGFIDDPNSPYQTVKIIVPENIRDEENGSSSSSFEGDSKNSIRGGTPNGDAGPVSASTTNSVRLKVNSSGSRKYHNAFYDPDISANILFAEPPPAGWDLALSPSAFTLALTNETQIVDLLYTAPTPGICIYYVQGVGVSPVGAFTSLSSGAVMLIAGATNQSDWYVSGLDVGDQRWKIIYGNQVTNVSLDVTNVVLRLGLSVQSDGNLTLLLPVGLLGGLPELSFSIDGTPVVPIEIGSNSLYTMVDIPYKQSSLILSVLQKGVALSMAQTPSGQLRVSWPAVPLGFLLEAAPTPAGPWGLAGTVTNVASNPYYAAPTQGSQFFRVHQ